jgi:hypothetical protein
MGNFILQASHLTVNRYASLYEYVCACTVLKIVLSEGVTFASSFM